jgi:hypothetical protein
MTQPSIKVKATIFQAPVIALRSLIKLRRARAGRKRNSANGRVLLLIIGKCEARIMPQGLRLAPTLRVLTIALPILLPAAKYLLPLVPAHAP